MDDDRLNELLDVAAGRRDIQVSVDVKSIALIGLATFLAMFLALFINDLIND